MTGDGPKKGRGAVSNPAGRFDRYRTLLEDDGWAQEPPSDRVPTEVQMLKTRSIIAENDSPDIPFSRSINPYRGCEHGCVYCFARPSHAYFNLSPGLDFETKLFAKPDAPDALRREWERPTYRVETIALGSNTDPYQPIEKKLRITRRLLEMFLAHRHPLSIVTKSALILRDLDLLSALATENLVSVMISVTTLKSDLARTMEPRASSPTRRLAAISALSTEGIAVGVLVSPVIPGLSDEEMEAILEAASKAGAQTAGMILVRLPWELKEIFSSWLHANYPTKAARVLHLIREVRGGALNDPDFGARMKGTGKYAELLHHRFKLARRRLGLEGNLRSLDVTRFRPPRKQGDQMELSLG